VFLLYFLLRRDTRALLVTARVGGVVTLAGFALAWRDSWSTGRKPCATLTGIGTTTLNTNQNIAARWPAWVSARASGSCCGRWPVSRCSD
jgi:alpha-1,2-mannosyltransferase